MARKKELDDEKVLADIYNRAVDILENEGIEKISVRKVCNAAGISTGTFYNFYPTKDHLIARLLDGMRNYYEKDVFPTLTGNSYEQLEQILTAFLNRVMSRGLKYAREFYVYYTMYNKLFLEYSPYGHYLVPMLQEKIQNCIEDGFFPADTDRHQLARQLMLLCHGTLLEYTFYEDEEKVKTIAQGVFKTYLNAVKAGNLVCQG